ncbi:uncharacterized protein EDB93DRAFT_923974 [Suillus bovinus]|uniref:uncharacterized protein n=1 Tax=Suillus bovinus TaxID=48563 RepID=UPI001B86F326|nr:uncharacterized protein EDB93DRAFT_923974 [Suillus bovinus]KAG2156634.1 hypothetical protein EDB93DRAFT_923974 [Suillus bovinus]
MLSSWLSKKSNNTQAISQPDRISKASQSTVELTGHSSQSAIPITDDDHNDVHEHIWDPSTYSTRTEQDALKPNTSATTSSSSRTSSHVKLSRQSTEPAKFLTPHDDILAELHGYLPSSGPQTSERQSLRPDAPRGSSLNLGSSAAENSLSNSESLPNHEPARETMYEPYTGQKLSDYVSVPARSGTDDELWSHLSHILELQSEISKMHVEMENAGLRTARGHREPERGGKAGRRETKKNRRGDTLVEEEDDDESSEATEGEDSDQNDEVFGKKKRDEEFTRLAERFEERKVSIDTVMTKLDNLSSALKAFHALPIPALDVASSRNNTVSSYASLTTDRAAGAASAVTSTTSAPPRISVQPLVTTIIDDSQRVDSPVDMHLAQFIPDRNVGKK